MSMTEILEELPRLGRVEREKVRQRLEEIELGTVEETPEMLAAIDAGRRSIREGKATTIEQARNLVAQWTTKSS
jgi:hypothetical protein